MLIIEHFYVKNPSVTLYTNHLVVNAPLVDGFDLSAIKTKNDLPTN